MIDTPKEPFIDPIALFELGMLAAPPGALNACSASPLAKVSFDRRQHFC
jgi:hypothetical protein